MIRQGVGSHQSWKQAVGYPSNEIIRNGIHILCEFLKCISKSMVEGDLANHSLRLYQKGLGGF